MEVLHLLRVLEPRGTSKAFAFVFNIHASSSPKPLLYARFVKIIAEVLGLRTYENARRMRTLFSVSRGSSKRFAIFR